MSAWKPGDVAANAAHGYRGIWIESSHMCAHHQGRGHWHNESGLADGPDDIRRPLVVIDPEDREQVRDLLATYGRQFTNWSPDLGANVTKLQAALRSLVAPPKPPEPLGLGAVVEDEDGRWWSRLGGTTDSPWHHGTHGRSPYSCIAAVKVLSEGVTP